MPLTLADAWLHDLNPFVLRFTDTVGIRWYGLAYALAFVAGYLQLKFLARRGLVAIPAERCGDVILSVVVGVVVGGRLGYVLLYEPSLLWDFEPTAPWWGVLAINRGGMASHGGMVGVILAAWRVSRGWKKEDGSVVGRCRPLHVMDVFAFIAPIGLLFGRLANFINGELLGRVIAKPGEVGPWWGVRFPQEVVSGHACFRTAEQEAYLNELIRSFSRPNEDLKLDTFPRMLDLIQSGGAEGKRLAAELAPLLSARFPSQLLQAAAEGVVLGLLLWAVWARPRVPGVVGAWFLMGYGVLRVATEFVRLPDAQLEIQRVLGLSRGQWFSVLMVVAGAVVLAVVRARGGEKMGGWWGRLRTGGSAAASV